MLRGLNWRARKRFLFFLPIFCIFFFILHAQLFFMYSSPPCNVSIPKISVIYVSRWLPLSMFISSPLTLRLIVIITHRCTKLHWQTSRPLRWRSVIQTTSNLPYRDFYSLKHLPFFPNGFPRLSTCNIFSRVPRFYYFFLPLQSSTLTSRWYSNPVSRCACIAILMNGLRFSTRSLE